MFSDDDVLDYLVGEAILMAELKEKEKARKAQERRNWRNKHKTMRHGGG